VIVNIARGQIIKETDLLTALDAGTPGLVILDVFAQEPLAAESPFWTHPRVRLSPHNSNNGDQTPARGDRLFLNNLRRLSAGEPLLNEVLSI
jgi:phosphoglycerate dehydrogenase-like enzyme